MDENEFRVQLLERLESIDGSLGKLASDPEIEIEAGPAFCPHCGKHNPTITVLDNGGEGPLAEFLLVAECHNCNHTLYGIVESWSMFTDQESLAFDLEQRVGGKNE